MQQIHEGDPDAVNAVLQNYAGYIRCLSKVTGWVNTDVDYGEWKRLSPISGIKLYVCHHFSENGLLISRLYTLNCGNEDFAVSCIRAK
ncbi:MAG: helix-turn-helix domain-containing protein [Candidatus Merdivicinus sp.]